MPALLTLVATLCLAAGENQSGTPLKPVVEIEEDVYSFQPANNGAGPMWCSGSTCLVRIGDRRFASGLETLAGVPPLNNCRWTLFERTAAGWQLRQADPIGRTREPCPLAGFSDGRLFLSANPTLLEDPKVAAGPARPEILQFAAADPQAAAKVLLPEWEGSPPFSEHSYRSFAADAGRGELILLQNIGYTHAEWAFWGVDETGTGSEPAVSVDSTNSDGRLGACPPGVGQRGQAPSLSTLLGATESMAATEPVPVSLVAGRWAARGKLVWPWGAEYDNPQPIRVCYPNVALNGRRVYFSGVSDIVEPYNAWRAYKKELTGRDWDYDFRRLFYTWSDDITKGEFHPWVEIASCDKTCGWIMPGDLWAGPDGTLHLLWSERKLDERLRRKFFPDAKQRHALEYARVRGGEVVLRRTVAEAGEGLGSVVPGAGRFQATPDNRLFVVYYAGGTDASGNGVSENRVAAIGPEGDIGPAAPIPLKQPFTSYFTATPRAGSPPSEVLEMLGHRASSGGTISYARVRLY